MIQQSGMQKLYMISTNDIRIRDPFIVADEDTNTYYLFGTTDTDPWNGDGDGFMVYESKDLEHWSEPIYAFKKPRDFWATKQFWAPEVHHYNGYWYMLASFKSEDRCRGTQILRAEQLTGPYEPISDGPVTPKDWECLDGTLFIDAEGKPWIVFSHEWTQIGNGAICAAELTSDLTDLAGEPVTLFHAKDAPWCVSNTGDVVIGHGENYVTDGPFIFDNNDGILRMIWSSFSEGGYSIGVAESESGNILGPWTQQNQPVLNIGGHGMLFNDFSGKRLLSLHSPNTNGDERLKLIPF